MSLVPYWSAEDLTLYLGDCRTVMAGFEAESFDAVVCDPPYDLTSGKKGGTGVASLNPDSPAGRSRIGTGGFMGQSWDATGVAFDPETWRAVYRVMKPGGHLLAAGSSRTFHRLVCAIEDAGFEIRDTITHHFGSGFPKNRNVSDDLRGIPSCTCDVADQIGTVSAVSPPGTVGAGVGAEPAAVPLTGERAHLARRIRTDVGPDSPDPRASMEDGVKEGVRNDEPVMLRSAPMAIGAQGDQVGHVIGGFDAEPEALRNHMMRNQLDNAPAIGAPAVPCDDPPGHGAPCGPLVIPFTPPPSRVGVASETTAIGDSHAIAGAIDGLPGTVTNGARAAFNADKGLHDLKCKACGGVRRHLVPEGLGTALKPATEFWTLARKPLAGTVVQNVLAHGTGALNIGACRVAGPPRPFRSHEASASGLTGVSGADYGAFEVRGSIAAGETGEGRWPSNVLFSHSAGCEQAGTTVIPGNIRLNPTVVAARANIAKGAEAERRRGARGHGNADGTETVPVWICQPGCPVAELDRQSGVLTSGANPERRGSDKFRDAYGEFAGQRECVPARGADSGGASRFFHAFRYEAKAGAAERPRLPDGTAHPTVKPSDLMTWLVKLVSRPGALILDPFAGSGTTGEACLREGRRCVLIEREPKFAELARVRLSKPIQPGMFDMEAM